jgi:signal transduction histidine kinase
MPGGGTLTISAGRACSGDEQGDGQFAEIVITDTGVGIPEEVLRDIFQPFFSTKGTVGVGLGLSLSQHIIKSHGGRIDVQSAAGKGSEFRVLLPVTPPRSNGESAGLGR